METIAYYMSTYWLSGLLVLGAVLAGYAVYRSWSRIVIKGSGRK
ncbi:hypothetical protein [Paenibacillus sp. YYML68]|nr:hypothetical protein [Paenibacillus sp. YYML68]